MGKQKNRYLVLLVLALGAVGIYFLPYLRWAFYDTLFEAVGLTNTQFAATLRLWRDFHDLYAPGGYLADKFSPRKMLTFAFAATGLLGLWFSTFPGFISQMIIYSLWGSSAQRFLVRHAKSHQRFWVPEKNKDGCSVCWKEAAASST